VFLVLILKWKKLQLRWLRRFITGCVLQVLYFINGSEEQVNFRMKLVVKSILFTPPLPFLGPEKPMLYQQSSLWLSVLDETYLIEDVDILFIKFSHFLL